MTRYLFCLIFILINYSLLHGQNLLKSRTTSYKTNIYKITDKQAEKIYKKGLQVVDRSFFYELVDTYPTDSSYREQLPFGHYLLVWTDKNELKLQIQSVNNVSVKILKNGRDLMIILYNSEGSEINDAEVFVGRNKLPYDNKTQTYRDSESNLKGILKINYNDISNFTYLDRQFNNPGFIRTSRSFIWSTPIKYFWLPIKFVLRSPVDAFNTLRTGYPRGIFYLPFQAFHEVKNSIIYGYPEGFMQKYFCMFDPYYCEEINYKGYMVFNKPKFRPGDTVKLKAFITTEHGSPIDKPLEASIQEKWKYPDKKLDNIYPYRPGAYEMQFLLHDSLNLTLDKPYMVSLKHRNTNFMQASFKLEDYELKSNEFKIRLDKYNQFRDQGNAIYLSGKDINGLNLFDVRAEIHILSVDINKIFKPELVVKDTLWNHQVKLENTGETKVILPDSIFPLINGEYKVVVNFYNAENEKHEKIVNGNFFQHYKAIEAELTNDSIFVAVKKNNDTLHQDMKWFAYDKNDHILQSGSKLSPGKIKLNEFANYYKFFSGKLDYELHLELFSPEIFCLSDRDKDSVRIMIENPRKLKVRFNIYKVNRELERGIVNKSHNFTIANTTRQKYFISLQYVWNGETKEDNYEINWQQNALDVKLIAPKVVYPGQETELNVVVKDANDEPAENVDLLAYGVTKKFRGYRPPTLPYFGKEYKNRTLINNFTDKGNRLENEVHNQWLAWNYWKQQLGLDSIEYYQFLYHDGFYQTCTPSPDNST